MQNNIGSEEMMGLQVEHRVTSRRHHSHHHRHRHRSHHSEPPPASAQLVHHEEENNKEALTVGEQKQIEEGKQKETAVAHEAPETSRASTRSSRLPARRSERGSVAGPGSTFGNISFHEVTHPTGEGGAAAEQSSRKPSQLSVARSSSANFPSTSELSAMMKKDKAVPVVAATATAKAKASAAPAVTQAPQNSATHSISFFSSSHDGDIDFHTETQKKTGTAAATGVSPQLFTSHTTSSVDFFESSQDSAMQPAAAAAAVAPKDATMSSKKSGHHSRSSQPQLRQSMDVNSKRSRTDDGRAASANATAIADKEKEPSEQNRTAASSTQADVRVASLNSVPSPLPAGAAPESPAPASSAAAAAAAAALAALQTTPQPDAIVRSWQADVTPNRHDPPSSLTSSICRGRDEIATAITDDHKEHRSHRSRSSQKPAEHRGSNASPTGRQASENGAAVPASSSHRHQHGRSSHHRRHASTPPAATASSLHRDSRSSSHYDKAVYPPPPPSASVKKEDDGKEREESKSSAADSPEQQQQRGSQAASEKPFAASSVGSRPAASANGRTPQRTRASSATAGRHSTEFKPFQLSTERRSTVRRVSSPQAYVPRDPLLAMPKEERERLMALPHDALNAPGMWRLDMRYEEDRKEYYRQTHLVDPMTRTKPSTRQFYIPEQADLFGMYPNIQMTTDEEGNEVVVHLAPVPIRGESFVKERKPYTPPRASPPRKSAIEENLAYPPPEPAAVAASLAAESKCDANATVGQPGSGLSGLVWGYGEEARARPGGLTPPRGRVVSDITAPYRRNPAKSTGQIGHLGGDGTLNIFRVSASAENDGHEFSHMRDISQASTSFAVMQPTPSPSVPTTTNSDYGQQQQHQQQSPHCYAEASSPPPPQAPSNDGERSRREGRESGAVVLQPSVGGNSDSRSPSDGVFAVPQGAAAAAAVVMPMAIQTGGDADDNDAYSEVKSVEKQQQQQQQQPKQPSAQEVKPTDTDTKPQPEEQNASERSSRRREQASMSGEPTTSERCSRKDGKASAPSEKSTCSNAKLSSVAAAAAAVPASKEKSKADTVAASKPESVSSSSHKPSSRHAPAPSSSSLPSTKASASAKAEPHLAAPPPAAAGTATSSSSGLHTPTSAMPDAAYPLPSPTPLLPVSASSRASKERKRRTDRREDADSHNSALKAEKAMNEVKDAETSKERRRKEKPSRASSSTDVPPPLPPPPSVQRATTTTTATTKADPAVATAPSSSAARTQEASVYMTDVASARDEHYDPTATSELRAPAATTAPAPSAAPVSAKTTSTCRSSSSSSVAVDALLTTTVAGKASSEARESRPGGSSSSSRLRHHRASVSSATSAASSSAPESKAPSEAHSSAFSHPYTYASELNTPDSSVREPRGSSAYNGSHRHNNVSAGGSFQDKPIMSEGGTQTEFVFVLDPLQGRQFLQREQELVEQLRQRSQNVLYITDTRRNSSGISTSLSTPRQSQVLPQQQQQQRLQSGDRSVSPSEQRAAGISTGVSPTHMRRTSYANTSTNVRNLLRWT